MEPFIVDVSANQDHPINWAEVKKAGCKGVILKATQGTDYVNPFFERDLAGCDQNDLPVMAYHFAMFTNVKEEVKAFRRVADARARALDIETSTNLAWANEFLALLQKDGPFEENQTMLYGSASNMADIRRGVHAKLWVAAYHTEPDNSGVPNTSLWQYSETGHIPGIANDVDISKWVGAEAEYKTFFGLT